MNPNPATGLRCTLCGTAYPADDRLTCGACGPADGILDVEYDYEEAARTLTHAALADRPRDHWRYREVLPVPATVGAQATDPRPPLQVGFTPVYEVPRVAARYGAARMWLKDDGRNPTASFKDRASSVGVAKAVEFGYGSIACASTGNAASSLAGMAAAAGLRAYIFVPKRAPQPKLTQLLVFGATVIRVDGTYDQAYDLCMAAAGPRGWYQRNCAVNPYLVEGKKTCGLEIAEQCAALGTVPDWVVTTVGDGCSIAGVWKGLREARRVGLIDRTPRMLGVQAEGSPAVARQFAADGEPALAPAPADTVADSICVGVPRNWRKAVRAVRESGGAFVTVSDADILTALKEAPALCGVFGEPACAAAFPGVAAARAAGIIGAGETVLVVMTGNGLKDIGTAAAVAGAPLDLAPTLAALDEALGPKQK